MEVDNGFGKASLSFTLDVEVPPVAPSTPDILDIAPTGRTFFSHCIVLSSHVDLFVF